MKVKELLAILQVAILHDCGELEVAATINPDASTLPKDLAYGDIDIVGPHYTGRVFGITAIKDEFPEAMIGPDIAVAVVESLKGSR